jgi:dihydrofolate reductase
MTVIASIVLGSNGATSLNGSSIGLSTPADRTRFLARHKSASAFIIGKKSAVIESYAKSLVPIYVLTRSPVKLELPHPLMEQIIITGDLSEIVRELEKRTSGDIVVEAGPVLLMALVEAGVITTLELSISPIEGDGNFLSLEKLLSYFEIISDVEIDGTRLLQCRYKSDAPHS